MSGGSSGYELFGMNLMMLRELCRCRAYELIYLGGDSLLNIYSGVKIVHD